MTDDPVLPPLRQGGRRATLRAMKTRRLGNTDLLVSAVGLRGVPLSVPETRPDEAAAIKVIHHAVDQGVTFIDTPDSYGRGLGWVFARMVGYLNAFLCGGAKGAQRV